MLILRDPVCAVSVGAVAYKRIDTEAYFASSVAAEVCGRCRPVFPCRWNRLLIVTRAVLVVDDNVIAHLWLQSGGDTARDFRALAAAALGHAHKHTTFCEAAACEPGRAAVAQVSVVADNVREPVSMPQDCDALPGAGGYAGDRFFVLFYVDGILV